MQPGDFSTSWWDKPRFAYALLILLVILFNFQFLSAGFYGDDLFIVNAKWHNSPDYSRWLGSWAPPDTRVFDRIWWKDDDFHFAFWRPIPSLLIEGAVRAFGYTAWPLHLLSLLLHSAIACCLYGLVRLLTRKNALALLAGLFYITCEDHGFTIGWISTITDMVCVLFIVLGFLAHVEWLQRRRTWMLAGALTALMLALTSKETAVVAPIGMVLLSLLMPNGHMDEAFDWSGASHRIRTGLRHWWSWAPALLMLIGYFIAYKALGFGTVRSVFYVDPLSQPGEYLSHLVWHLPVMWLGTLSVAPLFMSWFVPGILVPMTILGLAAFALLLVALYPLRQNTLIVWALVFYSVALLPQVCTDASERGLYFPMIPGSILLAYIAAGIKPLVRRTGLTKVGTRSRWTPIFGWLAVGTILIPGALLSAARPWLVRSAFEQPRTELKSALPYLDQIQPSATFIVNSVDLGLNLYAQEVLNTVSSRPFDVWVLSSAFAHFTLSQTGDSSCVIRADKAGWLSSYLAKPVRTRPVLEVGRRYESDHFSATLLHLTPDSTDALEVRFDFKGSLRSPTWLFLRWNGHAFEPLDLGSLARGETVDLGDFTDAWKESLARSEADG